MPERRTTTPDPARTIALLWGHHPPAGRSGLTVPAIVEAGIAIADADGLAAVSMRRVADHLGVGTMSLYGHVPGKADLTDLMVDAVLAELYDDVDEATRAGDWRGAMRHVARANWDLYDRHPWMLDIDPARPVLGPHTSRKYETELRPLDGIGLSDVEIDGALTLVLTHVGGTARARREMSRAAAASGMDDAEWWALVAPALERLMVDPDLKVSARVGQTVGELFQASADPVHAFEFGLEIILDGIEARIARSSG